MPDQQQPTRRDAAMPSEEEVYKSTIDQPMQTIRVFGQSEQPAYERTVAMREVTFTCIVCQQQVTQLRYPGPPPRYCSEDCRAKQASILNQERVRKQREKRQATQSARSRGAVYPLFRGHGKPANAAHLPNDDRIPNNHRIPDDDRRISTTLPPLLASRLSPPRLPALLVERTRLLALLDAGQKQKLTLLQAPAGFGKTTLVNQWITHRGWYGKGGVDPHPHPSPTAWISLESDDNDPIRFWISIIVACQN